MTDFANLRAIGSDIFDMVESKDRDYGSSWRRRGGTGAFMVMARKWDRIENMAKSSNYDIFVMLRENKGGIADDVRDLVGYLMLILEHASEKPAITSVPLHEFEQASPRYISDGLFLCEGGWGSGQNLYTCRRCKTQVKANELAGALLEHRDCPKAGGPTLV
jgi:hypothetical protein